MTHRLTDEQLRDVSAQWLAPIDYIMADLLDKSERMTIGAFNSEVEQVVSRIPQMFGLLDRQALIETLEDEIGAAMLEGLQS
tara:strand:+ start:130 stop:375 length:246 start_codon:yes stop_codon:yes gene_type:complete